MAITPDKVQIGTSSDYLDGVSVDTGAGGGLFRETVVAADPENGEGLARVLNSAPASDAYGSVVRVVGTVADSTDTEWTPVATTVTAIGDTTIYTPAAGKRIRLHWIYGINDPVSSSSTKITVKMGAQVYYVAWAISKRQRFTGALDAPLIINLSATGDVAITAFLEEI